MRKIEFIRRFIRDNRSHEEFPKMSDKRPLSDSEGESNEQATNQNEAEEDGNNGLHDEATRSSDRKKAKRKKLEFEHIYLSQLPSSECYEKSYMHKENITHVLSANKTDFIITGKFICN